MTDSLGPVARLVVGVVGALFTAVAAPALGAPCATCHSEIAREWEGSAHRRAGTDPAYVMAVAKEPLPFCRACHVPSGDASRPTPVAIAERGVGCTDCHDAVGAAHGGAGKTTAPPARACAGCHEFRFAASPGLMQRTATEHAASAFASTACASCHMPGAGTRPHKDHRFQVDDAMLARALVADVTRAGPTRVALRLRPGDVGHAMPTGDLFRRLEVRVVATGDAGEELGVATRFLSRKFRSERTAAGTSTKIDARDDRVGAGLEPCFELDVGAGGAGRPLAVTIQYQRVQEPRGKRESDAVLNGASLVWSAVVRPEQEPSKPCR